MNGIETVYGIDADWLNHPAAQPALLRSGWYRDRSNALQVAERWADDFLRCNQGRGSWIWADHQTLLISLTCGYEARCLVYPFEREERTDAPYAD